MTDKMATESNRHLLTLCGIFAVFLQTTDCHGIDDVEFTQSNSKLKEDFVKDVHIIFMNHLDVGYNGVYPKTGFINNVLNTYFTEHFPRALNVSRELKNGGYAETFIYTTHPWLIKLYMDCPENFTLSGVTLKCPTKDEKEAMYEALRNHVVTYHAGPMNMQPENMNELMFEMSLNISDDLDTRIGMYREFRTLSQRDVPGMTKAVIPILLKKDIVAVSVGVNDGTSPPAVPTIFNWQYDEHTSILAMWHKGGYPDNPGPNPANPGGLSRKDCVVIQDFPSALCFAFRTDNSGPPESVEEILGYYEILRRQFPNANLHASEISDFVSSVWPIRSQLPTVTNEIGDTWIGGISSDPKKMAEYRVVTRLLTDCIKKGDCDAAKDNRITDSVFNLIKLGEHTWGLPGVYDTVNWTNHDFYNARSGENYKNCEQAWQEQRDFVRLSVTSLHDHPIVADIEKGLEDLKAQQPSLEGFTAVDPAKMYTYTDGLEIQFGKDGALVHLYDPRLKMNWASAGNFGSFIYRTYDEGDFNVSHRLYPYKWDTFFNKPNLTRHGNAVSKIWEIVLDKLFKSDEAFTFIAKIVIADYEPSLIYGGPREIWITYDYHDYGTGIPGFDITLQWFDKPPTRLPESIMYYFSPLPPPPSSQSTDHIRNTRTSASEFIHEMDMGGERDFFNMNYDKAGETTPDYRWKLRKLGRDIDAATVVLNGSQYLHAVDSDVFYTTENNIGLQFYTQDVPLVSLGTIQHAPSPFPIPLTPIEQGQINAVAFNLYNNIWDTNYILWYPFDKNEGDFKARFKVNFLHSIPNKV